MNSPKEFERKSAALDLSPDELRRQQRLRLTAANGISFLRVLALPFIHYFLTKPGPEPLRWAVGPMLFAALTDMLDGFVARRLHVVSDWGKIVDPLADKICIGSVAASLTLTRDLPIWVPALIIIRDVLIVGGGVILGRKHDIVLPSNQLGRVTTVMMSAMLIGYTLRFAWAATVMVPVCGALVLLSSAAYAVKGVRILRQLRQRT